MTIRCFLLALLLIGASSDSFAIADGSSCSRPDKLIELAAFGQPNEMKETLIAWVARRWNAMPPQLQNLFQSDVRSMDEWRIDAKNSLINAPIYCGNEWLLDYAVSGGNIAMVQWLLDEGADPNAGKIDPKQFSSQSIFFRCPNAITRNRPDGISEDEARQRTFQAYKLLIKRGADINRATLLSSGTRGLSNALVNCSNDEMIPVLLALGVERSPQFQGTALTYVPLQESLRLTLNPFARNFLERAKLLAQGGFNDLKGTSIEQDLREDCTRQENTARCSEIAAFVKLSPGTISGVASRSTVGSLVPEEFRPRKEVCAFPELQFFSEYDVVSIAAKGGRKLGLEYNEKSGEIVQVDVIVNNPGKPIFLFLDSEQSTIWNIARTGDTKIIGVAAHKKFSAISTIVGLEVDIPTYVGYGCGNSTYFGSPPKFTNSWLDPNSVLPLRRTKVPQPLEVLGDVIHIGASLSPLATLITSANWTPLALGARPIQAKALPLQGHAALDALVQEGKLQKASATTFVWWATETIKSRSFFNRLPSKMPPFWNAYVLLDGGLSLPKGLQGPDAPVMFVADAGLYGDPGDATIFFFFSDRGRLNGTIPYRNCVGPRC